MKITAYSDNICPFCYIGSRRIRRLQKELNFDVEWKAFEIHPDTPQNGISMEAYFNNSNFDAMQNRIESYGSDTGIKLNNKILSNSHLSLMANEYAKRHNKFYEFHDAIYRAYFDDGEDIGDIKVILDIAGRVGLDKEGLKIYLQDKEASIKVSESSLDAEEMGITGVPAFIIEDEIIVGAQPYETMKQIIQKKLLQKGAE